MSLLPEINQASAEINKLVAQANIHQTIAPVDPAAFTDPADTMLLASRDPVIREVSVGMTGEAYSDYSVSGTPPLSLPNSLGKPLKAWSVDVLPKQDLNGYDAPWPAGGGANIWDEEWEEGRYNPSTGEPTTEPGIRSKNFIPVVDGNSYYLYCGSQVTNDFRILYYDDNKTLLSASAWIVPNAVITLTTASYIKFYVATAYGSVYKNDIAINYPSSVTTYSPYSNICPIHGTDKLNMFVEESYDPSATPKAVITLPQTVYTGTIGSEGGESRWGKIVLDGSETWGGSGTHGMYTQVDTLLRSTNYYTNIIKCESLKTYRSNTNSEFINQEYGITGWAGVGYPGQNWIYIAAAGKTTTTELKAWLAQNPVTVVYELATPTTFPLTPPTIPTPTGTATTWATAEDGTVNSMEVTYVGKA